MDASGPQRCERAACPRSLSALSLSLLSLADKTAEVVDASCLAFLVRRTFEDKERVMQEIHRKVRADEAVTDAEWAAWKVWRSIGTSSSAGQKRKSKKKRKRKLPKYSSGLRLRRCGQGFRSRSSFSGAQCSLLLTTGPRCSASWPVRNRSTVTYSSCARWVLMAILHLALCSFLDWQAPSVRHSGRYGPERQLCAFSWQGWYCWLRCPSRCVPFSGWQAPNARHYGRYGPEGQLPEAYRLLVFLGNDFCRLPYSALSLVRQRIHALRQSTVLTFQVCLRIQRSAWFDCGYMRCVSLRGFLEEFLTFST